MLSQKSFWQEIFPLTLVSDSKAIFNNTIVLFVG